MLLTLLDPPVIGFEELEYDLQEGLTYLLSVKTVQGVLPLEVQLQVSSVLGSACKYTTGRTNAYGV